MQKRNYILDVGSSKLRLIATSHIKRKAEILLSEDILYDGFMDGEFLSPDEIETSVSKLIATTATKLKTTIKSVFVGVPSEFCVSVCKRISRKFIGLKKINQKDIDDLILENMDFGDSADYSIINYSPMQYILDDNAKTLNPVGQKSSTLIMDVSFILARKSFMNFMVDRLNNVGVNKVDFVSTALGQAVLCSKQFNTTKSIVVVDVGHITTSICVLKGEGIALLSSFSIGGGHISSDIMQVLGLNFKESELVKRKVILTIESLKNESYEICAGNSMVKAPINMTNQIVKSRIEHIAQIVEQVLSVDEVFKDAVLYLTGDGIANFKGVKRIFKDVTGLEVVEFKNQYDYSKNKYQTSANGLVHLVNMMV